MEGSAALTPRRKILPALRGDHADVKGLAPGSGIGPARLRRPHSSPASSPYSSPAGARPKMLGRNELRKCWTQRERKVSSLVPRQQEDGNVGEHRTNALPQHEQLRALTVGEEASPWSRLPMNIVRRAAEQRAAIRDCEAQVIRDALQAIVTTLRGIKLRFSDPLLLHGWTEAASFSRALSDAAAALTAQAGLCTKSASDSASAIATHTTGPDTPPDAESRLSDDELQDAQSSPLSGFTVAERVSSPIAAASAEDWFAHRERLRSTHQPRCDESGIGPISSRRRLASRRHGVCGSGAALLNGVTALELELIHATAQLDETPPPEAGVRSFAAPSSSSAASRLALCEVRRFA